MDCYAGDEMLLGGGDGTTKDYTHQKPNLKLQKLIALSCLML